MAVVENNIVRFQTPVQNIIVHIHDLIHHHDKCMNKGIMVCIGELILETTCIAREKQPVYKHVRETLYDDQELALENDAKQQRYVSIQEEQLD